VLPPEGFGKGDGDQATLGPVGDAALAPVAVCGGEETASGRVVENRAGRDRCLC
jgi:hypothetical protein